MLIKKKLEDATAFQTDRIKINKLVLDQSLEKIKRDNYKGLNLTELKITLLGEVSIAEQEIREVKASKVTDGIEKLYKKVNELREL